MDKNKAKKLAELAVQVLDDKKAFNLKLLDVSNQTVIADYFVLACGTSNTHINALADELETKLSENGFFSSRREGRSGADWIVVDYDSTIVHLFTRDTRTKFNLDKLWADAEEIDTTNLLS